MSSNFGRQLSLRVRNLIPNRQQWIDGAARFVAVLLIYSVTVSTGTAVGIASPDARHWNERFDVRGTERPDQRAAAASPLRDIQKNAQAPATNEPHQQPVMHPLVASASSVTPATNQPASPVIQSVSPNGAFGGTDDFVRNRNFGSVQGTVTLNGVELPTYSWTSNSIFLPVPQEQLHRPGGGDNAVWCIGTGHADN